MNLYKFPTTSWWICPLPSIFLSGSLILFTHIARGYRSIVVYISLLTIVLQVSSTYSAQEEGFSCCSIALNLKSLGDHWSSAADADADAVLFCCILSIWAAFEVHVQYVTLMTAKPWSRSVIHWGTISSERSLKRILPMSIIYEHNVHVSKCS